MALTSPISLSSATYEDLLSQLRQSYPNVCVLFIDQINNTKLTNNYVNFNDNHLDLREQSGWHGTRYENIVKIIENGFDPGANKRSAFGKGTYLAKNASYSKDYAPDDETEVSYLLYCKFAYKALVQGYSTKAIDPINAACDQVHDPTIYVVPSAHAVLPLYLVAFYKNAK